MQGGMGRNEGKNPFCLLMRCGFGGFSGSICWPMLPHLPLASHRLSVLVTPCAVITSDMGGQEKETIEEGFSGLVFWIMKDTKHLRLSLRHLILTVYTSSSFAPLTYI